MPLLPDVQLGAIPGDNAEEKLNSLVRQINEWARIISNQQITNLYQDTSGTNRILIGIDPDGEMNIHISKEGEDVVSDVFS